MNYLKEYNRELEKAGLTPDQFKTIINAWMNFMDNSEIKSEFAAFIIEIDEKLSAMELRLILRLGGLQIFLNGLLFYLLKH